MLKTNPGAPPLLTHTTLNPEAILKQLTLNEKISLLSGVDMYGPSLLSFVDKEGFRALSSSFCFGHAQNRWHTQPIDRLGVPSVRVSDGPNGKANERLRKFQW